MLKHPSSPSILPVMTQQSLLELAKQGNPHAIAALINHQLQPRGITAKANLTDSCLIVMLESSQVLEQQALVALITKQITSLSLERIKVVKIYGIHINEDISNLNWHKDIELKTLHISRQSSPK